MVLGGEEWQQGATASFLLQLLCSVQARQGDIQVLCCCCHICRGHRHDLIQVVSGPLMVSFDRNFYFLGWHRNWYRLGRNSGWVRSILVVRASSTSPNQTWIPGSTEICGRKLCYSYSKIYNSNIKEATASSLEQFSECF